MNLEARGRKETLAQPVLPRDIGESGAARQGSLAMLRHNAHILIAETMAIKKERNEGRAVKPIRAIHLRDSLEQVLMDRDSEGLKLGREENGGKEKSIHAAVVESRDYLNMLLARWAYECIPAHALGA